VVQHFVVEMDLCLIEGQTKFFLQPLLQVKSVLLSRHKHSIQTVSICPFLCLSAGVLGASAHSFDYIRCVKWYQVDDKDTNEHIVRV